MNIQPEAIRFWYVNHRGEKTIRHVMPLRIWFGQTQWHPEPQWFLDATDLDKDAERSFALTGLLRGDHP